MMKSVSKCLLVLPSLLVTSCGYRLKELYNSNDYNSIYYSENYVRTKVDDFKGASRKEIKLDQEDNYVFTSLSNPHYTRYLSDPDQSVYKHLFDKTISMIQIDDSFEYGMNSKLFDGWWECGSHNEKARIQIDEDGFDMKFEKQCRQRPDYLILSFQSAIGDIRDKSFKQYKANERYPKENLSCEVTLNIDFYLLENNKYSCISCSYDIEERKCNQLDFVFFGFELGDKINLSLCKGVSISYKIKSIKNGEEDVTEKYNHKMEDLEGLDKNTSEKVYGHALWLYEFYLANSTWH